MKFHTLAIYEAGVLRPLVSFKPLNLQENQVVSVYISPISERNSLSNVPVREHSAFLNGFGQNDEELYEDYIAD